MFLSKKDALKEVFDIELSNTSWPSKKVSRELLLEVISRNSYNLKDDLGICAQSVSVLLSKLWPDRPKGNIKVCTYLLGKYNLKCCPQCKQVLDVEEFHNNISRSDGLAGSCIVCFNVQVKDLRREYQASVRAKKLCRTPKWADTDKIKEIYKDCPEGHHVDHVIPLQGELVSGLHVEYNLQYLTAEDNIKKSNSFIPT